MRVHLGCGADVRPGWFNIDAHGNDTPGVFLRWDLSTGLPEQVRDVTEFYSSHFWEHLPDRTGQALLAECWKRLSPNGRFRMALPDFRAICAAYLRGDWAFFDLCDWEPFSPPGTRTLIDVVSWTCYQYGEHKSVWDADKAVRVLSQTGFSNVRIDSFRPGLDCDSPIRRRYSFYAEGTRAG